MSVLTKQFKDALAAIEPGEDADHAAESHAEVRALLARDDELTGWGLDTVLIGSYKRHVSIRRVKDVDVFCKLPDLPADQNPQELLDKFAAALSKEYCDRVTKNDRSLKVDFPDFDMHVDVVPARVADNAWEIPDRDGGWERTDPVHFGDLTTVRNQAHNGAYVPTVKLLRQTRRALLGDAKPGGLFVEVAAYHAFAGIPKADESGAPTSTAEYYTVALERMAPILRYHADGTVPLTNPALPNQDLHIRATQDELDAIAEAWEGAAIDARAALESDDDQEAGRTFKNLLGANSDGDDVFTVPAAAAAGITSPGQPRLPSGNSPTYG